MASFFRRMDEAVDGALLVLQIVLLEHDDHVDTIVKGAFSLLELGETGRASRKREDLLTTIPCLGGALRARGVTWGGSEREEAMPLPYKRRVRESPRSLNLASPDPSWTAARVPRSPLLAPPPL